MAKKRKLAPGEKGIKTVYYIKDKDPKVIWSKDANRAVTQMVGHMQINHYGADIAEVYDDVTGELHAQCKRLKNGSLLIWYNRNPGEYETRYAMGHLLSL